MTALVVLDSRVADPLLPLRLIADRNRGGVFLAVGLAIMAMFGQFLILTLYFQLILGYSPIQTGLAFLPLTLALAVGSTWIGRRLVLVLPTRWMMVGGYLLAAAGFLSMCWLTPASGFWQVLPGSILIGLGAGAAGLAANSLSTHGVDPRDAGVVSAALNTSQQLGGAIGTALLSTIAAGAAVSALADGAAAVQADMSGYLVAFAIAGALVVGAALTSAVLVTARLDRARAPRPIPVPTRH